MDKPLAAQVLLRPRAVVLLVDVPLDGYVGPLQQPSRPCSRADAVLEPSSEEDKEPVFYAFEAIVLLIRATSLLNPEASNIVRKYTSAPFIGKTLK